MSAQKNSNAPESKPIPKCGIVMPIAAIDGCPASHWADVLVILKNVISTIDFEPNLVSDADEIGIIQKRIIQNLYNNEIVVCDVSAKNPNVMFELGMRLAFDKPTIIIKDDKTDYTFDTSVIEHLTYPRDLRLPLMIAFQEKLKDKIKATYSASKQEGYSTFLKNFGEYKVAHLTKTEVSKDAYVLQSLEGIYLEIRDIKNRIETANSSIPTLGKFIFSKRRASEDMKNYVLENHPLFVGLTNEERIKTLYNVFKPFIGDGRFTKEELNMVSSQVLDDISFLL